MKNRFTDDSGKLHSEWWVQLNADKKYIKAQEAVSNDFNVKAIKRTHFKGEF